jgi:hypothetical protein
MLKAYVDDSRMGDRTSPLYVLGGWLAPVKTWTAISDDWDAGLRMSPRIDYFKFDEAMGLTGQFHGMSEMSRDEKMTLLMNVLADHRPEGIGAVIPTYIFEGLFGRRVHPRSIMRNPYFLGVYLMVRRIAVYCTENNVDDIVELAFDYQPTGRMEKVQAAWEYFHRLGRPEETRLFPRHPPSFLDDKKVVAIQAADLNAGLTHLAKTTALQGRILPNYPWLHRAGELNRHDVELTPEGAEEIFNGFFGFKPTRVGYQLLNVMRATAQYFRR